MLNLQGKTCSPHAQKEDSITKSLRIKTNSLLRNIRDLSFSKQELVAEEKRLNELIKNQDDKINQQRQVVEESKVMIPQSINRIYASLKDLDDFLKENELHFQNGPEVYLNAKDAMAKATAALTES